VQLSERQRDWLMVIPAGILFLALSNIIDQGRAFAFAAAAYVFYAVISHKWSMRSSIIFWIAIGVLIAMHIAVLSVIPFPYEIRPGLITLPFAVVDGVIMWYLLDLLERKLR
jgi:hypothetical protein